MTGTCAASQSQRISSCDLRESAEPDLDGEVAARDHDRERLRAGALNDDLGKSLHRERRLDLCSDPEHPPGLAPPQLLLQVGDIACALHERVANDVRFVRDQVEIGEVLRRQRVEAQLGVGEVEPLSGAEASFRLHPRDPK